ncbi:MAG: protein kinase domain-containing protein [Planctomycetaceae bacterium]
MAMDDAFLAEGQQIGSLRVLKELGRGAFGRVYLAEDTLIGRRVALKVVPVPPGESPRPSDEAVLREARAVGRLSDPGIVTLFRVHAPGERSSWMFEMEFVEGGALKVLLEQERVLAPARALAVARGIASAVDAAHAAGVVHGDLKPENVLLRLDGGVKLADFGLSRILADRTSSLSSARVLAGTPLYMAPEVIVGERASAASDIWSFGVLCYRMLSGDFPFRGDTLPVLFYAIQAGEPVPLAAGWPPEFEGVEACLAKDPAQRPRSLAALVGDAPRARQRADPPPAVTPPPRARAETLAGREKELASLEGAWRAVAPGRGLLALVSGEAGIGKSALLRAFRAAVKSEDPLWVESAVTPFRGLGLALLDALRDQLARRNCALDLSGSSGAAAALARQILDDTLGLSQQNRVQAVSLLDQLLHAATRRFRIAVCVEDAHLADEEDTHVLLHLARRLPAAGGSLLVAGRTLEGAHREGTRRRSPVVGEIATLDGVFHLEVGPLAKVACFAALEAASGGGRLDPLVADRIYSCTQGNPLFALELLRHLEGTSKVRPKEGTPSGSAAWGAATLPRRFHDVVALRLGGLGDEDRAMLDAAAVDGRTFDGDALAAVLDQPLLSLLRQLQRVSRESGLIAPSEEGYRFTSALIQEVIYNELAPELRKALHRALALHLEGRPPEARPRPERLGLHWIGAGEQLRARPHLLRAARAAASRQELRRCIDLCTRAGFLPDRIDAAEALREYDLVRALIFVYHDSGQRAQAYEAADKLLEAARHSGESALILRAQVASAELRYFSEGAAAADETNLRRAAAELPHCNDLGMAQYLLGVLSKYRGRLAEAEGWLRGADAVFRELGNQARHSSALDQLASVALRGGRVSEAESLYREAARISAEVGRKVNAATSEVNRVLAALGRGALDGLEEPLMAAIHTLQLEGARNLAAHATVCLATLRYAQGDAAAAYRTVTEALSVVNEARYLPGIASAGLEAAQLAIALGLLDEARCHLDSCRDAARRAEDSENLALAWACEAQLLLCGGDAAGAAQAAREAVSLAVESAESRLVPDLALWLAETSLLGLPAAAEEAARLLANTSPPAPAPRDALAAATVLGARAWAEPGGSVGALRAAAAALRGPEVAERRAMLRVCADLLEAEAEAREGDGKKAEAAARRGLHAAQLLGNVWLRAALLRFLRRTGAARAAAAEMDALLEPVLARIPDPERRRLAGDAWLRRG